jgi:hypothetical protein
MSDYRFSLRRDLAGTIGLSTLVFLWAHGPSLGRTFVVNDDVRQQLFWMERWRDPGLFPNDLLAAYAEHYVPWGVRALYRLAAFAMDPLSFSKLLAGALFVGLVGLGFAIGAQLGGRRAAWAMASLIWLTPFFLEQSSGGLARAFAAPVLALFALGWLNRRASLMAAALVAGALFAPYAFLLCAAAWSLGLLASLRFRECAHSRCATVCAAVLLGTALSAALAVDFDRAGFGPLATGETVRGAAFGAEGRYPLLPFASPLFELVVAPLRGLAPFGELGTLGGALVLGAVLVILFLGLARSPRIQTSHHTALGLWLLASGLLYVLARAFALRLFFPSRFLEYTGQFCVAGGVAVALSRIWPTHRRGQAAGVAAVLLAAILGGARLRGVGLVDFSDTAPLALRLATTHKDALVAGHPYRMDNVLAFGHRRVLASYELAHPWSTGFWTQLEPRLHDLFGAYYAGDRAIVDRVSARYGIDYWVVDDRDFTDEFLQEPSAVVPLCRALHLPAAAERACNRLGLEVRAPDEGRRTAGCPGRAPFFTPFDAEIRAEVAGRVRFVLLDDAIFPGERVGPHVRLVRVEPAGGDPAMIGRP